MSPSCDDLDPFFDGELPAEGAAAFREHLGGCARCQRALRGRMLEALVVTPSQEAGDAATRVPAAVALRAPRRTRRWAWVPAVAAAAAAVALWWKIGPSSEAPPAGPEQPEVALALKPQRRVDVRFSDRRLDGYREREVVRSGSESHEEIGRKALAALEERNDLHALVGALALKGELASAAADAGKLPATAAALSDRAALALLEADPQKMRANAERALSLAVRARRLDPALEQAIWNEAVALEQLQLTLAAAAAFDEIAQRGTAGWSAEAGRRAAGLRSKYEGDLARADALLAAADAMERGGPVLDPGQAARAPSLARKALHVALAATAERARLAELAPLAGKLAMSAELDRVRASDLSRRAPLARRFAAALAKPDLAELRAVRAAAGRAGALDIARAVALAVRNLDVTAEDASELEALAAAGPWWRLASTQRLAYFLTYRARSYAEADLVARDAVEACRAGARERDAYWCPQLLRTVAAANAEVGRVDRAYELLDEAQRLADEVGERREEARVLSVLGQIASTRIVDAIDPSAVSSAYLRESDLRLSHCWSRLFLLDFPARAALDHHRFADAERLLADADRLNQTQCKEVRYNAEEVRLRLIVQRPSADRVGELARSLQRIEASHPDLDPPLRLYGAYLLARARLAAEGEPHVAALRDVLGRAQAFPDEGYPHTIRIGGHSALAEHAARRGAAAEALAAIAARMGVALEDGCAVGVNHGDRVTVVVRGADGGAEAAVREVPEGRRVLDPQELIPAAARRRLAGCPRVDVLATGPYFGVPGLFGPELSWAYRSSPRRRTEPLRLAQQVVVTDVQAPPDLRLPALRRMELAGARTLEGTMATPEAVLGAIADADLVVINAHGITNANEPSAASLVLSPDPKLKGSYWLTADRVKKARLARSPVVILAACHAGRVQVSTEPWSLASSFLSAGARAVIAPTTEIPDQDANEVFESIIARMQAGSSPEQAVAKEREERGGKSPWLANVVVFQ